MMGFTISLDTEMVVMFGQVRMVMSSFGTMYLKSGTSQMTTVSFPSDRLINNLVCEGICNLPMVAVSRPSATKSGLHMEIAITVGKILLHMVKRPPLSMGL